MHPRLAQLLLGLASQEMYVVELIHPIVQICVILPQQLYYVVLCYTMR